MVASLYMSAVAKRTDASTEVRTRLMRSAERLLESSIDGEISTREICAGAHVTAPTLYHHFKDKDALLDAVVLEGFTAYLDAKRSVMPTDDVREAFHRGWDMHVAFGCEHPGRYRLMFGNPQADRVAPAARLAREELERIASEWDRTGRLRVSADAAAATMSAAAIGVTFQLIGLGAQSAHPISINVRDTVARALFDAPPANDDRTPGVHRCARQLLDALPQGPLGPLRSTETALLREWLSVIAGGADE